MQKAQRQLADSPPTLQQTAGVWLASYPLFQDALQRRETCFRSLPPFVKLSVLRRLTGDAKWSPLLHTVRASYVELSTPCVVDAVRQYLTSTVVEDSYALETLAAEFPPAKVPLVARPPCLLSPGKGIFMDGWDRFFAYFSRNDETIPLLAVDWLTLSEGLSQSDCSTTVNWMEPLDQLSSLRLQVVAVPPPPQKPGHGPKVSRTLPC
jgi:hypothetical protein